ncbi:MAG TPA: dihydrolipoamide acetyltransferase family protein [Steroidobacteraceae bacterium]|nr:dihydrolipoamide acetyltransferase family protein [Steroidobacteraceae bacterium]
MTRSSRYLDSSTTIFPRLRASWTPCAKPWRNDGAQMTTFNLPDLGEGLAEAEIVRWHVSVGDVVTVDQPMLAVETAKAVVEVPAPFSGVVKTLHGQPGDLIATGAPLIEFEGDTRSPPATKLPTRAPATRGADGADGADGTERAPLHAQTADSGTVVGSMPTTETELIETALAGGRPSHAGNGASSTTSGQRLRAAPAARALAKKLGLDLTSIRGSGRGGVIVVDDVIAKVPTTAQTPGFTGGEKLRGLRRAMAQSMSLARDNVVNCTLFDDADLHNWREGQDFTTRLLRAIAAGCKAEPALNAWYDGNTQSRRLMTRIDVGMAVDTPEGLIVPVIRDIAGHSTSELRDEIDRVKRAAHARTLTPEDLRDVTFLLSNFGMIAGRYATPVVVPPAVAILGSGRLSRDVVAARDGVEVHLRTPLSLTFDHRCVTGGEAARFMAAVLRDLEKDN